MTTNNKKSDFPKASTALITGGTGFLGIHLARYLVKKKYKVILLDTAPLTASDLKGKVKVVRCDIRNFNKMMKLVGKVDYVVHAAAALPIHHDKEYIFDVNVNGTENILKFSLSNEFFPVRFVPTVAFNQKFFVAFHRSKF